MSTWSRIVAILAILFVCLTPVSAMKSDSPAASSAPMQLTVESVPVVMVALPGDDFVRVPPPPQLHGPQAPNAATFSINYVPNGTGDGQGATCLTWDSGAQAAFSYAASIWASQINSSVPIRINACWANLGSPTTLGYSWSNLTGNFTGAPYANTWYAYSLADRLAGTDLYPASPDFYITYNTNFAWYTGTDGNTPGGQYDLVSVALHEMGHGLNFAGSMQYGATSCTTANYGCWGYGTGYPNIYDRFTQNGSAYSLINTGLFPNPSVALGTQLIGGNLYFSGTNANAANSGSPVRIYAPGTWSSGSSYSHLDDTTFSGTPNRLMVYAISSASSIHDPGSITMGLLNDLGWQSTVLVDDGYNSSTAGWGQTHFASIQNGINAIPSGGIVLVYDGTYTESPALSKSATISMTGNITVNGSLSISAGTFNAPTGTLRLSGDLTRSGGTFNHRNGTIVFSRAGTQNLALSSATTFNNLTVNSGATLVETVSADNATVSGTLLNNGTLSKTQSISGTGVRTFGLTGVSMNVATQGALSSVEAARRDANHPNATVGLQTGRYWTLTPIGSGFNVTLTLPVAFVSDANDKLCRYTGTGSVWDCAMSSFTTSSITRGGVTTFSDWAGGNNVGPTAIALREFQAQTSPVQTLPLLAGLVMAVILSGGILFRHFRR